MITSAYILPHSPLLIPSIGKQNLQVLKQTVSSLQNIAEKIQVDSPDTILIITPHGLHSDTSLIINASPTYNLDFKEFGDLALNNSFNSDLPLANKIYQVLRENNQIKISTSSSLDHGVGVPLYYISNSLNTASIIPLHVSSQDSETHFKQGQAINPILKESNKKITIIASGELSHKLSENSSLGYSKLSKKFDQKILDYLKAKDTDKLINIDQSIINDVSECGLKSIALLLGILDKYNYTPELISYEKPFGVGHLTYQMKT